MQRMDGIYIMKVFKMITQINLVVPLTRTVGKRLMAISAPANTGEPSYYQLDRHRRFIPQCSYQQPIILKYFFVLPVPTGNDENWSDPE
jgi:hypothetical protein